MSLIIGLTLSNLRKGLQAYIVSFLFVQPYMTISLGGSFKINVSTFLLVIILCLMILYSLENKKIRGEISNMRLNKTIIIFLGILLLSVVLNVNVFDSNVFKYFLFSTRNVGLVYIGWLSYNNLSDGLAMNKKLLIVICALAVYGIIELLLENNPLLDYLSSQLTPSSSDEIGGILRYDIGERGYRVQSLFYHPYSWGGILIFFSLFPLYFLFNQNQKKGKTLYFAIFLILFFNVFFTRGRSTLIPELFVTSAAFIFSKKKISIISLLFLGIPLIVFLFFPSITEKILPYFSLSQENKGALHGSSIEMREAQLFAVLAILKGNILTGNGFGSAVALLSQVGLDTNLQGLESFWLSTLLDNGIIGLIAYLILFFNVIRYFFRQRYLYTDIRILSVFIIIGILGYLMFITMTGTMFTLPFFFLLLGIMAKYTYLQGQQSSLRKTWEGREKVVS